VAPGREDVGVPGRITLLTDFGTADGYVAAMRGVIASRAAGTTVEDATHDIPAGDIPAAAHAIAAYWDLYPPGTVHVAVVDPGVGGDRRAIAVSAASRFGVGPDNGVLSPLLEKADAIHEISAAGLARNPRSATFDGRDLFAPAAAYLASGGIIEQVGRAVADPVRLKTAEAVHADNGAHGRIVHVDRFGNLISNVPGEWAPQGAQVLVNGVAVGPVRRTYAEVASGELVAVIGSRGQLEVSVRDGSAVRQLGVGRNADIRVINPQR
jgi:S-adenosylmethionine hydrolase